MKWEIKKTVNFIWIQRNEIELYVFLLRKKFVGKQFQLRQFFLFSVVLCCPFLSHCLKIKKKIKKQNSLTTWPTWTSATPSNMLKIILWNNAAFYVRALKLKRIDSASDCVNKCKNRTLCVRTNIAAINGCNDLSEKKQKQNCCNVLILVSNCAMKC